MRITLLNRRWETADPGVDPRSKRPRRTLEAGHLETETSLETGDLGRKRRAITGRRRETGRRRLDARASAGSARVASSSVRLALNTRRCAPRRPRRCFALAPPATRADRAACRAPPPPRPGSAASSPSSLDGVRALRERGKSVWLLDQFGVLHDGVRAYPCAIEACREPLRLRREALHHQQPRRAANTLRKLEPMGFDPAWFEGVVTSGEIAHDALARRSCAGPSGILPPPPFLLAPLDDDRPRVRDPGRHEVRPLHVVLARRHRAGRRGAPRDRRRRPRRRLHPRARHRSRQRAGRVRRRAIRKRRRARRLAGRHVRNARSRGRAKPPHGRREPRPRDRGRGRGFAPHARDVGPAVPRDQTRRRRHPHGETRAMAWPTRRSRRWPPPRVRVRRTLPGRKSSFGVEGLPGSAVAGRGLARARREGGGGRGRGLGVFVCGGIHADELRDGPRGLTAEAVGDGSGVESPGADAVARVAERHGATPTHFVPVFRW